MKKTNCKRSCKTLWFDAMFIVNHCSILQFSVDWRQLVDGHFSSEAVLPIINGGGTCRIKKPLGG